MLRKIDPQNHRYEELCAYYPNGRFEPKIHANRRNIHLFASHDDILKFLVELYGNDIPKVDVETVATELIGFTNGIPDLDTIVEIFSCQKYWGREFKDYYMHEKLRDTLNMKPRCLIEIISAIIVMRYGVYNGLFR